MAMMMSEPVIAHEYRPLSQSDDVRDRIRPVTIFQVLQGDISPIFEDKSLFIEGRCANIVTLVAHVTSVERRPACIAFVLEDGTGRIRADKVFDNLQHHRGESQEVEEEEVSQSQAYEHTYVQVIGHPEKNIKWGSRIKIYTISPAHGYNQVMYHILNVIHSNKLVQQFLQPDDLETEPVQWQQVQSSYHGMEPVQQQVQPHESDMELDPQEIQSYDMEPVQQQVQPYESDMELVPQQVQPCDHDTVLGHQWQQQVQSYSYANFTSSDDMDQDHTSIQRHVGRAASPCGIPSSTFSPQKRKLYATLEPLQRAIMEYVHRHKDQYISITKLGQVMQASERCSESQFDFAIDALLLEAYITSPLDDGRVVLTPRR